MSTWVWLQGFGMGAAMIIPIGAQNAFVLNQGIKKQHHLIVAAICAMCDALLVFAGIFGGSKLLTASPLALTVITCAGVLFLSFYGLSSLHRAWKSQSDAFKANQKVMSRTMVISATLAVTLLNPHVYLDTFVVLGSIGASYAQPDRLPFALGIVAASFFWFFSLSTVAAKMAPILNRPKVQRIIDLLFGVIMLSIAWKLMQSLS
ncbi:LysE/ArgO family amino acid transporter [Vibrio genomosp. F10]|uniref:LysE/ArgO family amino acid transporter n=1 Tax=Vibrio genomosp. F10 TaxID=723171 RepID=UPI000474E427|nr:LysE/ArgO family amino acid transporter [Vibrio genomosp. F10]OEF05369.1 amino acid transporter [Vibrio genomosp. F10 str. 9ZB36]